MIENSKKNTWSKTNNTRNESKREKRKIKYFNNSRGKKMKSNEGKNSM